VVLRKINTRKKSYKKPILIGFAVILLLAASVAAYFLFIRKPDNKEQSSASDSAKDVADNIKKNSSNSTDGSSVKQDNGESSSVEVPKTDGTLSDSVGVTISGFSQSGGTVTTSATVTGSTGGICYFIFSTEDAKPVNRSSALNGNSCSTSISEVEFSKLGTWKLTVSYVNGDKNKEASQNVTIK